MNKIRVGLIGLGNIGSGVYEILTRKKSFLAGRANVRIELARACDRMTAAKRRLRIPAHVFSRNAKTVLSDPSIDIVIELIGGLKAARWVIREALGKGKHVVSANKALLAERGPEIFRAAQKAGREVYFEAAVGGGIPVIKSLRESLIANRFTSIHSIINGTCNYILTRMTKDHLDFRNALKEAQERGYAEADPTLDINGADAAHKITLMAMLAFGGLVRYRSVSFEGITGITQDDIEFAREFGYVIKLLAITKKTDDGIEARVQPTLLPSRHILANIDDSFNGILLNGDEVGDVLLYGRGAGKRPTASAVVSDVVDLARSIRGGRALLPLDVRETLKVKNISAIDSRYYVRMQVMDRPGVLSKISAMMAAGKISISDVMQQERKAGRAVPLILLTHHTREHTIRTAVKKINTLKGVKSKAQVIRIED